MINNLILRRGALVALLLLAAPWVARGDTFSAYQLRPALQFSLPDVTGPGLTQGPAVFDVLGDGRILAVVTQSNGSSGVPKLFVQHALHSTTFDPFDSLPTNGFFPSFGASFLTTSHDGTKAAISNNDVDVGVFSTTQAAAGTPVSTVHWLNTDGFAFASAWIDNNLLAVTRSATIGSSADVSIVDTSKNDGDDGLLTTIITGLNGSSGILFDYDAGGNANNLYTAEGFGSSAQPTGQIRKFTKAAWQGALSSGTPISFSTGAVVATFSSAGSLDIDNSGNLIVGGGPFPTDGLGVLRLSDPTMKRVFDPASTTGNSYATVYNPVTGEIYANEPFPAGNGSSRTVFVIAPVPEPGTFVLAAAGIGLLFTYITLKKKDLSLMKKCLAPLMVGLTLIVAFAGVSAAVAGSFANPSVSATDPAIAAWASSVVDFSPTPTGSASGAAALGPSDTTPSVANGASLGDLTAEQVAAHVAPGSITLKFTTPFHNGAGWDLAVFENAGTFFTPPFVFGELGYVEVSSNGTDFARFPSTSLNTETGAGTADTDLITTFGRTFAGLNPTNVHNLVGIHPAGFGTEFDLDDLLTNALVTGGLVNLNSIQYVRVIDIPGYGNLLDGPDNPAHYLDSLGNPILDTWTTAVGTTGGLDLDAVGARFVPEPESILLALSAAVSLMGCQLVRRRRRLTT